MELPWKSLPGFVLPALMVATWGCATVPPPAPKSWVEKSNQLATEYALADADRYPESASDLGFTKYGPLAMQLEDDMETRDRAKLYRWKTRLEETLRGGERDIDTLTDIRVLLKKINDAISDIEVEDRIPSGMVCAVSRFIFSSLRELVNEQTSADQKRAATERFNKYVRGHGKFRPYAEACRSRLEYRERKYGRSKMFPPLKAEVEQYLKESSDYVLGTRQLLESTGVKGWESDFYEYKRQILEHDRYVRERILPATRTGYQIPRDLYVAILRNRGIDSTPEELIRVARKDFTDTFKLYRELAAKVARKFKLRDKDPLSVLKFLKRDQITQPDQVKELYETANRDLTKILLERDLITLPAIPLKIRLAGDVESKASPVPHMNPPPLIGNTGQRPEFVVPTASKGKLPFDDFSYRASAMMLTAHEGRPGHDLQFSNMLDHGVSLIRARFAFNNVNVEGWGLYAEDIVFPHLTVEAQFAGLQLRLVRIARMFLDPEVLLGLTGRAEVMKILSGQIGISETFADLEFKRYSFDIPGQAPAYYYGLKKILEMRQSAVDRLGKKFSEKCFNDGVLSLGLLPLDLISEKLKSSLKCSGK